VERPSFWTRAKQRIWRDTYTSAKGRVIPFIIAGVGIVITLLTNFLWLHLTTAKQLAVLSAVSLGGSYAVWFLCILVINTVRVPWLLDAESTGLINTQEARAEEAEKKLAEINVTRDKHELFGQLMQQGVDFSCQILECQSDAQFASWDYHSNEWIKSVQKAMRDMGFPADAVEFSRAGEYAEPVRGVINTGSKQEERARVLAKHQEYVAYFVQTRLR
jgi:hypothetical protein